MSKAERSFKKEIEEIKTFFVNNLFYILIGITIFIIGSIIVFVKYNRNKKEVKVVEKKQEQVKEKYDKKEKVHIVKKGEHLWGIAEKYYGSGYNAIDIAKANKITNPNVIFVGQKLIIPSVKARKSTVGEVSNVKTSQRKAKVKVYTVKKGDHLWKIALRLYGDGYAWIKIARANNLQNPGLIYPGQKLRIP